MKTPIWRLIPIIIGIVMASSIWSCVEKTDEPTPKIPDHEIPL